MNAERNKPGTLAGIASEATPERGSVPAAPSRSAPAQPVPGRPASEPPPTSESPALSKGLDLIPPPPLPRASRTGLSWATLLGQDEPSDRFGEVDERRRPNSEMRAVSRPAPGVSPRVSVPPQASAGYYSSRPPAAELIDVGFSRRSSAPPSAAGLGVPGLGPRILFPERIREQADGWLSSGSLSLPNCKSPKHARATQRALLLALLAEPGYDALPLGFRQRIGWLFSGGWENAAGGSSFDELSDLMTVLGIPAGAEAKARLLLSVQALVPNPLPLGRPPSSFPPPRR